MRVEKSGNTGLTGVRDFLCRSLAKKIVTLRAADRGGALDFECPGGPPTVRLVRHIARNRQARGLMPNLLDVARFAASRFGEL